MDNAINNQPEQPTPSPTPTPTPEGDGNSAGPIVGSVIVIIIIIIGGLYFWGQRLSQDMKGEDILSEEDALVADLVEVSDSDEVGAIEDDLNATDLDDLDADLENIDLEL